MPAVDKRSYIFEVGVGVPREVPNEVMSCYYGVWYIMSYPDIAHPVPPPNLATERRRELYQ